MSSSNTRLDPTSSSNYQSVPRGSERPPSLPGSRGFSTTIADLFVYQDSERVDCCAIACCGVFQSDRDRFLIAGIRPPSMCKRFWVHFVMPVVCFTMAAYVAVNIPDHLINEVFCYLFFTILIFLLYSQFQRGREKRMDVRKDILWTKYQLTSNSDIDDVLDHHRPDNASDDDDAAYLAGQTQYDICCSHPFCFVGCYRMDGPEDPYYENEDLQPNFCSSLYRVLCYPCCGLSLQLCGLCGVAQEAREVENLLPAPYRRIDYLTMQPMLEYYPDIYESRWQLYHGALTPGLPQSPWYRIHLSTLSKRLVIGLVAMFVLLFIWSFVGPYAWTALQTTRSHTFEIADFGVFVLAWAWILFFLLVVLWIASEPKTLEISVDAMIKYFASGFFLATTLALFFEALLGLFFTSLMQVCYIISGDGAVTENAYTERHYSRLRRFLLGPFLEILGFASNENSVSGSPNSGHPETLVQFELNHPGLYTLFLLANSFIVAALTEELCKYFAFRMVDHPDLYSQSDLEEAHRANFRSADEDDVEATTTTTTSRTEPLGHHPRRDYGLHRKSLQANGATITIAMVCVALGFACGEDLLYVFVYEGTSVSNELFTVIYRAIFPVHQLCAALQSLGVCERDIEKTGVRIGRILLPAILLHGSYDFFVTWIEYITEITMTVSDLQLQVAYIVSGLVAVILICGFLWYYNDKGLKQRERLREKDLARARMNQVS